MSQRKTGDTRVGSRKTGKGKRKAQVFLMGAIIATIYVITITMTIQQLQIQPVDDTQEELWALSHVYGNIQHELRIAMTMLLAAYTKDGITMDQLRHRFETIVLPQIGHYCERQEISAQFQLIQPLIIQNGSHQTNGLQSIYANVTTRIHMTLRTEHTQLEDERVLKIAYMVEVKDIPPRFRAELWTTTDQNIKKPVEQATVQLRNMESQEWTTAETFHNGTYYAYTTNKVDKTKILFDTGVLFEIVSS